MPDYGKMKDYLKLVAYALIKVSKIIYISWKFTCKITRIWREYSSITNKRNKQTHIHNSKSLINSAHNLGFLKNIKNLLYILYELVIEDVLLDTEHTMSTIYGYSICNNPKSFEV